MTTPTLADLIETAATVLASALAYTADPDLSEPILEALWLTEAVQRAVPPRHALNLTRATAAVADRVRLGRAMRECEWPAPPSLAPVAPFAPIPRPAPSAPIGRRSFDPERARLAAMEAI